MLKQLNRVTTSLAQTAPVKILQFGKGNFLRAFTDWMVDLLNEKAGFNGSIQIVQTNSRETDDRFKAQEGLFHVVINGIRNGNSHREIRLVSAVKEVINPYENYAAFLDAAENPDLRFIVSNTTEAGISFAGGDIDPSTVPESFPGKLTAFLYRRFKHFQGMPEKGLTVLPCELIEKNGERLRDTIILYADHWGLEEEFRNWIIRDTLFCNTLVDRIVPGFPRERAEEIWQETGYRDELIVSAEPYHFWAIEPVPTPGFSMEALRLSLPLEKAGLNVRFVDDLSPYRTSKVRILNGAHTCMVPLAYLRGLRTVKEAIHDVVIGNFIRDTMEHEIIPTLDLPEKELHKFASDVVERFQNPFIRHELMSIALNSVSKFRVRVLPSIVEYYGRKKTLPRRLVRALAALILFYKGEWNGEIIPLKDSDAVLSFFKKAWNSGDPSAVAQMVLSNDALWETDLTKVNGLVEMVDAQMKDLLSDVTRV